MPVSKCFLNPEIHIQALLSCLDRHSNIDGLSINFGIAPEVAHLSFWGYLFKRNGSRGKYATENPASLYTVLRQNVVMMHSLQKQNPKTVVSARRCVPRSLVRDVLGLLKPLSGQTLVNRDGVLMDVANRGLDSACDLVIRRRRNPAQKNYEIIHLMQTCNYHCPSHTIL